MQIARWLHVLAVVVWVGGMAFAHFALRPSVQEALEGPARVALMAATLRRFFRWVAASIAVIVVSGGAWIAAAGGFAAVGPQVHAMTGIGTLMVVVFAYIWMVPARALASAAAAGAIPAAAAALALIRRLVLLNLVLGVVTISVAMLGKGP